MSEWDLDVAEAMRSRQEVIAKALQAFRGAPEWRNELGKMIHNQIFVWEPNALEAFDAFWASSANVRRFVGLCYNGRALRYVPPLIHPAFHFCPAYGFFFDDIFVPKEILSPWAAALFRPTTRVICSFETVQGGVRFLPAILGTTSLRSDRVNLMTYEQVERRLAGMPVRDLMRSQYIQVTVEVQFPKVIDGMVVPEHGRPLSWLEAFYKMRLFLEQPFVGQTRVRAPKSKSSRQSDRAEMEVVKIHMRDPLQKRVPKIVFPVNSRLTGRHLAFEVEVRGHVRHCAGGVVTTVRPHTRGPKGVRRERVIKVVR